MAPERPCLRPSPKTVRPFLKPHRDRTHAMPVITLPDGSQRHFDHPVTVDEVAGSIGAGLRKAALAGRVNGKLVDTSHVVASDADLAIVTDKDADGLEII